MTPHDVPFLAEALERTLSVVRPERVVLFGSWARGAAGPDSDLDLLVVLPAVEDKREAAIALRRALADLPVPKDVVVTTPQEVTARQGASWHVVTQALLEGTEIYRREGL